MVIHEVGTKAAVASKGLLIYGAGMAGMNLVREIRANPNLHYQIIGFLDDDPRKRGASFSGISVIGCGRDATRLIDRYRNHGISIEVRPMLEDCLCTKRVREQTQAPLAAAA